MIEESFLKMLNLAKSDTDHLYKFIKRYEPLLIKYCIVNGIYYEDLHSQLMEVTIKAIKNFQYAE